MKYLLTTFAVHFILLCFLKVGRGFLSRGLASLHFLLSLPVLLASSAGSASSVVSANHHVWACVAVPAKCGKTLVRACANNALCPQAV